MKVTFNKSFDEKLKRMQELPDVYEDFLRNVTREEAESFIKIFSDGISKNLFGLESLEESTVKQKRKKGYSRPGTPLYGKGKKEKDSLVNVFEIVEEKGKFSIKTRQDIHHSGKIPLDVLLKIHTMGATIVKGDKTWRIKKRDAALIAMQIFERKRKSKSKIKDTKKLINDFIMKGDKSMSKKVKNEKDNR